MAAKRAKVKVKSKARAAASSSAATKGLTTAARKRDIKNFVRQLQVERRSRTHKQRAGWFHARVSWPLRDRSAARLHAERRRAERSLPAAPVPAAAQWQCAGPLNIGGRATAIVCDPRALDRILLGTAGGGVWKSSDAGRNWKSTMRKHEHNIGALALDPQNPKIVYYGTGEANLSTDSYAGIGLYKSVNCGSTWQLVASSAKTGIPTRIGALAVDPFDSSRIFLGGVSHAYGDQTISSGGLFRSADGGRNWTPVDFVSGHYWCHSVEFHPARRGWVFATITERGTRNGIWVSQDGGSTWSQANAGLPPADGFGRTRLAIAPSQPDTVYAIAALADSDELLGIFRSDDAGGNWRDVTSNFASESQMSYGLALAIHPQNPDYVLCGGVDLQLTINGGGTWRTVTRWYAERDADNYAHADHHALLMPPALPGRVYDANDGGLDVSEDGGLTGTIAARASAARCSTTSRSPNPILASTAAVRRTTARC